MSEHTYKQRMEYLTGPGMKMSQKEAAAYMEMQILLAQARVLAESARRLGFVLSIQTVPDYPLSMGNHHDVVTVTLANERYRDPELCPPNSQSASPSTAPKPKSS